MRVYRGNVIQLCEYLRSIARWKHKFRRRVKILLKLYEKGRMKVIDLSRELGYDYMSTYNDILHFIQQGLIEKDREEIFLTNSGRKLAEFFNKVLNDIKDKIDEVIFFDILSEIASSYIALVVAYCLKEGEMSEEELIERARKLLSEASIFITPLSLKRRLKTLKFVVSEGNKLRLTEEAKLVVSIILRHWEEVSRDLIKSYELEVREMALPPRSPSAPRRPLISEEDRIRLSNIKAYSIGPRIGFLTECSLAARRDGLEDLRMRFEIAKRMFDEIAHLLDKLQSSKVEVLDDFLRRGARLTSDINHQVLMIRSKLDELKSALNDLMDSVEHFRRSSRALVRFGDIMIKLKRGSVKELPAALREAIYDLKEARVLLSNGARKEALDFILNEILRVSDDNERAKLLNLFLSAFGEEAAKLVLKRLEKGSPAE